MKLTPLQIPMLECADIAAFPPTIEALTNPNGLLAWGGDLRPERLLAAYKLGIFPWYSEGEPILWWSPAPRCVVFPADIHLSRRTRRRYNSSKLRISADAAFDEVVESCAQTRSGQPGTWITQDIKHSFSQLHEMGYAHSVEVWSNDVLTGGIYGLAIGNVFFGESMFSRETDASKVALIALCRQLVAWNFELVDCQVANPHLLSLGAVEIERSRFEALLTQVPDNTPALGSWNDAFNVDQHW
jgi:leucyl/phenylalanyl-tRNA--protein transferase